MRTISKAIVGNSNNFIDAYKYTLRQILKNKYKIRNDSKIAYEAAAFLEFNSIKNNNVLSLGKDGIKFLESFEKYGDENNIRIQEECEYYFDTIFNSKKIDKALLVLRKDKSSKKSIIYLIENPKPKNNKIPPCLTCITFRIINNKLDMHCHMRANNAYRLLLINFFINGVIHAEAARQLGIKVGKYYHIVDSLHIYKNELEGVKNHSKW